MHTQPASAQSTEEKRLWTQLQNAYARYQEKGGEICARKWARAQRQLTEYLTGNTKTALRQAASIWTRCERQVFRPDVTPAGLVTVAPPYQDTSTPASTTRRSTYEQRQSGKPKADIDRRARRKCLTCGGHFLSEGPHNRRCQPCTNQLHDTGSPGQMIEQMAV